MDDIENEVRDAVATIIRRRDPKSAFDSSSISLESHLVDDLGFASMDLAELLSILEMAFNVDPFAHDVPITAVQTVGTLCEVYRRHR